MIQKGSARRDTLVVEGDEDIASFAGSVQAVNEEVQQAAVAVTHAKDGETPGSRPGLGRGLQLRKRGDKRLRRFSSSCCVKQINFAMTGGVRTIISNKHECGKMATANVPYKGYADLVHICCTLFVLESDSVGGGDRGVSCLSEQLQQQLVLGHSAQTRA